MEIRVEGLRFVRGRRVVIDIPHLEFPAGRPTAILGPNGAGKTTLLRLMAALEVPTSGRILAGEIPVTPGLRMRRHLAYVFQEEVFLRQSVRENLELGLKLRGVDRRERAARIEQAADLLGITHVLDRRADRLSGGEGRRASLARALCLRARLVLLDEPLAGLDPATYVRLFDELPRLLEAFRGTTVFVTHDHHEALRICQHLVVLVDGRVRVAGDKRDVALRPRDAMVAEALGYIVLRLEGREVAVRRGELKAGPGPAEFWLLVDDLRDLVEHREVTGSIGATRVHLILPATADVPARGDRMLVHAPRTYPVGEGGAQA